MSFTHLQVRSGYSLFKSTMTIDKLIQRAQALDFMRLALTEEEVLYGAIPFYKACKKNGIKPLLGLVVAYEVDDQETIPCVLLAKNNQGYQQLIQLSTQIQLKKEWELSVYSTDLICIVSTESAPLKSLLMEEQFHALVAKVEPIASLFAPDDFYIGVEAYEGPSKSTRLQQLKQFAATSTLQFTALHDVRYLEAKDTASYDCLQAIQQNKKWDSGIKQDTMLDRHLRSQREMTNIFVDWPELLVTTEEIVKKCDVVFSFDQQRLPAYPVPTSESSPAYLRRLCLEQLAYKYSETSIKDAKKRLDYELQIIQQLNISDYFLIVADFVQFAKNEQIAVGPGRGSAAGSIVSYLLGITNVNPLEHQLLFERFLNPERVTMPDIDIDFSDSRRDEVIEYVRSKYGQEHVAQIVTFGTFLARSLLRDLMKTMEIDHRDQAHILKHIPAQGNEKLLTYIKQSEEFQTYIKQSKKLRQLFSIAITLEGLPRHISTHAAGIVIGKEPLIEDVPLTLGSHDTYLTQYAMNELEAIGLLKIDILGLRNLSLMERIVQSIRRMTGEEINVDTIPEHDMRTFQLLQAGKTNGVFQLESAGMKNVLTSLKPTSIDDIIAVNALYRPGPMEHIPTYIRRKHGQEPVSYIHPDLEPILASTYGVLIYQEQIMQIAHEFAGLSLGEADVLRRAISKKNRDLIEEQKQTFISGCISHGYDEQVAGQLFSWIVQFANYGFNKSHSVAYSKIAYQLSYLKAHYPTYFFAQLLSSVTNNASKLQMYVKEANDLRITILPPSINRSFAYYHGEGSNIRIGLLAIKGIGYETVKEIIATRKERPFTDLFDFCIRTQNIKRNALETLILAGTFDETHQNRASLLKSIDQAIERAELFGGMNGQGSLFTKKIQMRPAYVDVEDFTTLQKLSDEKELMNMYVSSHPIKQYRAILKSRGYQTLEATSYLNNNQHVKTIGIVQTFKKIHTKRGDSMAFITLTDETGEMEAVVFPDIYRDVNSWLEEDKTVTVEGKISIRQNKKQLVINKLDISYLEDFEQKKAQATLFIRLIETMNVEDALIYLQKLATNYPGTTEIIMYNQIENKSYQLEEKYFLISSNEVVEHLNDFFGVENVVLKS